jgi:hypothetical protein
MKKHLHNIDKYSKMIFWIDIQIPRQRENNATCVVGLTS